MQNIKPKLKIAWATHEAAKFSCLTWHYSKCMPAGKLVKIGVWENEKFIGVVLFGLGATPNLSKSYGITMNECCELTRIALTKHKTPVSRIMAIAIKMLKKTNPGIRLIVSFADSEQGHHGGIYQAGGWVFSGSAKLDSYKIFGKKIHPRSVVAKYKTRAEAAIKKIDPNAEKIWGLKHRYLFPLDEQIKKQIASLSKPYPKRVELESKAIDFQSLESGAIPTNALHLKGADNGTT
jgi:hypothetical protein